MKYLLTLISILFLLLSTTNAQNISLISDEFDTELTAPDQLNIEVDIEGISAGEPAYLKVINSETGYRKLKFSNNSSSLYSPKISVINGGNDQLKITLRDPNSNINWLKMKLRPQASGSLVLSSYINEVGGLGSEWKTITIPLSDFDSGIDFSNIAYMEFPYSANAGPFELHISKVEFTGGSTPYLWFGDDKLNNIHDGNGSTYHMDAYVIAAIPVGNNIEKVELLLDDEIASTDYQIPYEFIINVQDSGWHAIFAKVYYNDATDEVSDVSDIYLNYDEPLDFSVQIISPENPSNFEQNEIISVEAQVEGVSLNEPTYLNVNNPFTGYRKLKFGYDSDNIYGPGQNTIGEGNTHLEITLRANTNFSNWEKIRIRPMAKGTLKLEEYANTAGGIQDEWVTISIPLEDFSSSIDFTNIQYFEFPYSADAGMFDIDIQKMEFVGSSTPFLWFGETKTDNKNDGNGGGGQLVTELVESSITEETLEKVNFYLNSELIGVAYFAPYRMEFTISDTGSYSLNSTAILFNEDAVFSNSHLVHVTQMANPVSPVHVNILTPTSSDSALVNEMINIIPEYEGIELEASPYLKVWNTETGYRKLKFGYDADYIYSGHADVIGLGNDTLEIVLKAFSSNVPWSKLRMRPSAKGNAGAFDIGIKSIKFTGSASPFIWFDENKNDNAHDGIGGNGRLFAEVYMPDPNATSIIETSLIINNNVVESLATMATEFTYTFSEAASYQIQIQTMDSDSLYAISDILDFSIYESDFSDYSELIIEFDQAPSQLEIEKAVLKYNKDFAYSLTLDDGKIDGYTYAFQLLNGGYIEDIDQSYPGLSFTDGCGNDIKFTAGLAWNSVNSSFTDIHINTPSYMTWNQLSEMHNAGWGILNHSYSHAAYGETDYQFQVEENNSYVAQKTGINMRHFVIPSGDLNYIPYAFDNNMQAVYSNKVQFNGYPSGIDIDPPFNTYQQQIYRRFLNDDKYDQTNISEKIDLVAQNSVNGNHIWYADFTHRVHNTVTGGCLVFPTFEYYMNYIESTYGKNGSDRVWVASLEDVYDYILLRENTELNYTIENNIAHIYLNFDNVPTDLRKYALSLDIESEANIVSVTAEFSSQIDYNTETGLINLSWTPNTMKGMSFTGVTAEMVGEEDNTINIYPNPIIRGPLNIQLSDANKGNYQIVIMDVFGKMYYNDDYYLSTENQTVIIETSNLKKGIYFIKVINEEQNYPVQKLEVL